MAGELPKKTEYVLGCLDFVNQRFYFLSARIKLNSLPLSSRNMDSRVLFRKALHDFYL